MDKLVLLYITNESEKEATKLARHLLEKRMIGCANILPVKAMYWWEGTIVDDDECVLIAKTSEKNFAKVRSEVEKVHPFEVPCIIRIDAQVNDKYFQWLMKGTED